MKTIEQNHTKSRNIILECLCHGLMFCFSELVECVDWLAFVIFVSDDPLRDVLENQTIKIDAFGKKIECTNPMPSM